MHGTATTQTDECLAVSRLLDIVGDRWTVRTVVALLGGPLRFNALRRRLSGISQQMLTRTLQQLASRDIVRRTVIPTSPPAVEYALTARGDSLAAALRVVAEWAVENEASDASGTHGRGENTD